MGNLKGLVLERLCLLGRHISRLAYRVASYQGANTRELNEAVLSAAWCVPWKNDLGLQRSGYLASCSFIGGQSHETCGTPG